MSAGSEELYVGYLEAAPPRLAGFVRRAVVGLLALAAGLASLLASRQAPFGPGTFEFGRSRSFEGVVAVDPGPLLLVERPGSDEPSRYHLVAFGKRGAGDLVAGLAGRRIRLDGTLVYRADQTMIEVAEGSIERLAPASPVRLGAVDLGSVTLSGEIVDGKCYLGVMKPNRAKPHRACAVRCLSGGVPPLFVVAEPGGAGAELLLVGPGGRAINREILPYVAEPVAVTGRLSRHGSLLVLEIDPATIRREE